MTEPRQIGCAVGPIPMADPLFKVANSAAGVSSSNAGLKLRRLRERLHLTLRAVEEATIEISESERNSEYIVSAGRLNQIENGGSLPSIYKLYSLAAVYQQSLEQMAGYYGIRVDRMTEHRARTRPGRTHLMATELEDPAQMIRFPIRFESRFQPEKTVFLSRLIESWGEIPVALLSRLDLKKYLYGYIGLEDRMMHPLLRPGSIVQIDPLQRKISHSGWASENDRPIYFLELRYSYECCWCFQKGKELTLVPHPLSPCGPRTIRIPDDGEVLGQVVGVALRFAQ